MNAEKNRIRTAHPASASEDSTILFLVAEDLNPCTLESLICIIFKYFSEVIRKYKNIEKYRKSQKMKNQENYGKYRKTLLEYLIFFVRRGRVLYLVHADMGVLRDASYYF